ncbi:hypothetical protein PT974_11254 [Cladobotryum mycophilum]|uniref:Tyrosine specific protein phosphatases domain-containing protein n=1 Tax=Cladobotryum mycophilum TaxID=491253 RepID=A0ABR0S5P3_9HYPO
MTSPTADLDALLRTDVRNPIPLSALLPHLSAPPFIPSRSLINARDVGADPDAVAWIGANVKRIFDLRKPLERGHAPDPVIPGVENYPTPSLDDFANGDGSEAWKQQYLSVAITYAPTYRAVLEHIRDTPKEPFLFHCTAGRDRTGVLAGLLHHLAGTAPDDSVRDYMLSRIGTEPARDKLLQFAMFSVGITDPATPGFYNLVDLRPEYWAAFLEGLNDKFGGWDGYVTGELGLSAEDLEIIKKNIREA